MSARFAELLAGSFNRFALLIGQVNKLKSAASWVAVAHRGAYVHGLGRRERNLHRDQFFGCYFASDGHPDALSAEIGRAAPDLLLLAGTGCRHAHERVERKRGLRRCSGWRSLALEPNMAIAGRDSAPPITLRPFV